jgi:hypothetical protein
VDRPAIFWHRVRMPKPLVTAVSAGQVEIMWRPYGDWGVIARFAV